MSAPPPRTAPKRPAWQRLLGHAFDNPRLAFGLVVVLGLVALAIIGHINRQPARALAPPLPAELQGPAVHVPASILNEAATALAACMSAGGEADICSAEADNSIPLLRKLSAEATACTIAHPELSQECGHHYGQF